MLFLERNSRGEVPASPSVLFQTKFALIKVLKIDTMAQRRFYRQPLELCTWLFFKQGVAVCVIYFLKRISNLQDQVTFCVKHSYRQEHKEVQTGCGTWLYFVSLRSLLSTFLSRYDEGGECILSIEFAFAAAN